MSDGSTNPSDRHTYLVTYDIANDKRLKMVFKVCKDHGAHLQFSVFEFDLNPRKLVQLQRDLKSLINHDEDQVLFVSLGPAASRGDQQGSGALMQCIRFVSLGPAASRGDRVISSLGLPYSKFDAPCYVV